MRITKMVKKNIQECRTVPEDKLCARQFKNYKQRLN